MCGDVPCTIVGDFNAHVGTLQCGGKYIESLVHQHSDTAVCMNTTKPN